MQINISQPGPPQMLELSMFGRMSPEMANLIQTRNNEVDYRLQHHYGSAGTTFIQQSNQFFQNYMETSGLKAAESMILSGAATIAFHSDHLIPLETYEELQTAHVRYQVYLMANPAIRQLYFDNRIEGYSETYENHDGQVTGFQHDTFREVVNGMSRSSYDPNVPEDFEEEWVTVCQDTLEDNSLLFQEKVNIINAWGLQDQATFKGIDSTSIDGFNIRPKS